MNAALRTAVRDRAEDCCEYCCLPQKLYTELFHVEHIIAQSHGGDDDPSNLALACPLCNLHKGPNLAGIDPATGEITPLYHPRKDTWADHFQFHQDAVLEGRTAVGRTTLLVLNMNHPRRVEIRTVLCELGWSLSDH